MGHKAKINGAHNVNSLVKVNLSSLQTITPPEAPILVDIAPG